MPSRMSTRTTGRWKTRTSRPPRPGGDMGARPDDCAAGTGLFRPLPLLGNPHLQTLLASRPDWGRSPLAAREHHVVLPDGDRVVLHETVPPQWQPGGRVAVLLHGLGGSHRSAGVVRLA